MTIPTTSKSETLAAPSPEFEVPSPRAFRNVARLSVVVSFFVVLLAPMLAIGMSPKLKMALAEIAKNGTLSSETVEILRRSTPLWEKAISLYNTSSYRLHTSSNSRMAVVGRDGWIFLGDFQDNSFSQSIRRRVLSDQELDYWTLSLEAQQRWLAKRGIALLFVVAPSQGSVYPEQLPDWSQRYLSAPTSFDRVLSSPRRLPIIDLRPALRAAKSQAQTYSPLNSHWTDYGAWVAWTLIGKELSEKFPGFQPFGVGETANIEHLADYANEYRDMLGIVANNPWDRYKFEKPFPDYQMIGEDGSVTTMSGYMQTGLLDLPRQTVNPSVSNHLTAMILRDSMGDALSPFLQSSFKRTIQLHHHRTQYPKDQINLIPAVEEYKPDIVIYVMAERYFNVPLGSIFYWLSVDRYGALAGKEIYTWSPQTASDSALRTNGDLHLDADWSVTWPDEAQTAKERVLRIKLRSSDYGVAVLHYLTDGRPVALGEEFYSGRNELYFHLPGKIDGDRVTIMKQQIGSLSSVEINSMDLRLSRPNP